MKEINVFSISGESKPSSSFLEGSNLRERFHSHAVFEAVNIENQNKRQATRKTKTKAEVSGTGKKPYKQKHTGRARQGSRRNPQYRGGGVAFGPTPERNFKIRVNKKVVKLALLSAWLRVMQGENVSMLDDSFSNLKKAKSKEFFLFLKKANLLENKVLLIIDGSHKNLYLSARNIPNVYVRTVEHYSVRDLLNQNYLLLDNSAVPKILDSLGIGKDKE